jgi:hypothetical protein
MRLILLIASQAFFLWMFLSTAALEHMAEAGRFSNPDMARHYASQWRHGMAGIWPVCAPGFFGAAAAAWFWSFGMPLGRLIPGILLVTLAALAIAGVLTSAGTLLILRDFEHDTGIRAQGPALGPTLRGIATAWYSLVAWNALVLSAQRALWWRSYRPLLVPLVFNAVLVAIRPFTFDDLVSGWLHRASSGNPGALASLIAIPGLIAVLIQRQLAWEQRGGGHAGVV